MPAAPLCHWEPEAMGEVYVDDAGKEHGSIACYRTDRWHAYEPDYDVPMSTWGTPEEARRAVEEAVEDGVGG